MSPVIGPMVARFVRDSRVARRTIASLATAAVVAAAGCSGGGSGAQSASLPEPFSGPREIRIETASTLDTVEVNAPVTLSYALGGLVRYSWTLSRPAGSSAMLDDPRAAMPTFTPDVAGVYDIGLTVFSGGAPVLSVTRRLTAATYLTVTRCDDCHGERATATAATKHGAALENFVPAVFNTPGCLDCHVLGATFANPTPVPGGWDDEAARVGFDPLTYPFTDYPTFVADFPTLAVRGSIQCESCHGPGSLHESDPRRTSVSTRAEPCGACHNTFGPTFKQWQLSAHANPPPDEALVNPDCRRCHTAPEFIAQAGGRRPRRDEDLQPPGVTCAVCHDPHSAANDSEVRLFGTEPVAAGVSLDAGRAAACVRCHSAEVDDPASAAFNLAPPPCATQADLLAGVGAILPAGDMVDNSFHGNPGLKLRNFTGDPNDPLYAEPCVTCHMAPASPDDRLGDHAMNLRDGANILAVGNCDRCHPGLDTFDRPLGKDIDGDGTAEGIQTEIDGLLEIVYAAIEQADAANGVTRPGGPGTLAQVSDDPNRTSAAIRSAAWNYNFVVIDGSRGVHNSPYAVRTLRRGYETVTGNAFGDDFPLAEEP